MAGERWFQKNLIPVASVAVGIAVLQVLCYMSCIGRKLFSGFQTRSDTNWAVQPQKVARGLKFWIKEKDILYYVAKTKTLISCTVTVLS